MTGLVHEGGAVSCRSWREGGFVMSLRPSFGVGGGTSTISRWPRRNGQDVRRDHLSPANPHMYPKAGL